MRNKTSILENAKFLILIGILAGAIGGLAIGVVTGRGPSASGTSNPK